ncbi:MAG: ferrous iron transport protein A [Clostridium argentinense]|uniref:Ferrous iron transport protein A n=1 Tax=Clostridium faecium TaxID=2762223 RepID=A0ABR8YS86_9CLOT|nr:MULTISPECIES: ferrous iron transport protein A [Clostridium]MBD8046841.1 ferrous iron transport protein A [Clostridium faecium]MBS5825328.1 ferrous iron transport protein A [Clostridium argentinense]MDU1350160.1 ferrous iron transport protein A [Clostridium argentinense]
MSIGDLKIGDTAYIEKLNCSEKLSKRLLALGFIEGTEIIMKKVAPLGDPIIINLRGTDFAIRKKDAKNIFIKMGEKN